MICISLFLQSSPPCTPEATLSNLSVFETVLEFNLWNLFKRFFRMCAFEFFQFLCVWFSPLLHDLFHFLNCVPSKVSSWNAIWMMIVQVWNSVRKPFASSKILKLQTKHPVYVNVFRTLCIPLFYVLPVRWKNMFFKTWILWRINPNLHCITYVFNKKFSLNKDRNYQLYFFIFYFIL